MQAQNLVRAAEAWKAANIASVARMTGVPVAEVERLLYTPEGTAALAKANSGIRQAGHRIGERLSASLNEAVATLRRYRS